MDRPVSGEHSRDGRERQYLRVSAYNRWSCTMLTSIRIQVESVRATYMTIPNGLDAKCDKDCK